MYTSIVTHIEIEFWNYAISFQLYSLLSFISPNIFKVDEMDDFVQHFGGIISGKTLLQLNTTKNTHH